MWLSVPLRTEWLRVWVPLKSLITLRYCACFEQVGLRQFQRPSGQNIQNTVTNTGWVKSLTSVTSMMLQSWPWDRQITNKRSLNVYVWQDKDTHIVDSPYWYVSSLTYFVEFSPYSWFYWFYIRIHLKECLMLSEN